MRNRIYILITLVCISLVSCVKELEIDPLQNIDASVALETSEDINAALIGAYGILHGGSLYGNNLNLVPELLGSSDYCQWRGTFQSFRQMMNKSITIENADVSRTWIAAYRAINVANNVLANLSKVTDTDLRQQFEAEAKFIRGTMHFELVRLYAKPWGATANNDGLGVPIELTAVKDETTAAVKKGRDKISAVYTQVLADLGAAAGGLPESYDGNERFRASTFTAKVVMARVYLQQGNYAEALK